MVIKSEIGIRLEIFKEKSSMREIIVEKEYNFKEKIN
jgi:hypothetical protein